MSMLTMPNLDPKNATALLDKVVGLSREITGHVLQKDRWIEAGEAQQHKGRRSSARCASRRRPRRTARRPGCTRRRSTAHGQKQRAAEG